MYVCMDLENGSCLFERVKFLRGKFGGGTGVGCSDWRLSGDTDSEECGDESERVVLLRRGCDMLSGWNLYQMLEYAMCC